MGDISKDERFAHVLKSRQFMKVPRKEQKTKIDKRFRAMFEDKSFKVKHVVDKRGRPVECHTSSEELKKFYDVSSDSEEVSGEESEKAIEDGSKSLSPSKDDSAEEEQEDEESDTDKEEENDLNTSDSDSTTDGELSEQVSSDNDEEFDHKWEELDANAPAVKEITKRLAVCNMDWDRIRAEDILAVFNSFKPEQSVIHSVKIYPSEYGVQRMEEEKLRGPVELVDKSVDGEEIKDDSTKEGSRYHREKLRQYQINRLKYYYAVVECDTPETADALYGQLNGMEYESSAVALDIRFIPDDITFDQEPKSQAFSVPDPSEYKPRLFINSALQQVKVNLTWDETDPKRRETLQKAFREPESIEKDIQDYLASSSSSDDDDPFDGDNSDVDHDMKMEKRIDNYRALVHALEEKEKEDEEKYEMEITWESGMKEKTKELVKDKLENASLNPFEEKVKKIREDKKLKKKEMKMKLQNEEFSDEEASDEEKTDQNGSLSKTLKFRTKKENAADDKKTNELALMVADSHDDDSEDEVKRKRMKPKKQKKEARQDDFQMNIDDPRFSAIYTSHLYNIDPSNPHYKETKGMQNMIQEKQNLKRKYQLFNSELREGKTQKQTKLSAESQKLVNSVRRKAEFHSKK